MSRIYINVLCSVAKQKIPFFLVSKEIWATQTFSFFSRELIIVLSLHCFRFRWIAAPSLPPAPPLTSTTQFTLGVKLAGLLKAIISAVGCWAPQLGFGSLFTRQRIGRKPVCQKLGTAKRNGFGSGPVHAGVCLLFLDQRKGKWQCNTSSNEMDVCCFMWQPPFWPWVVMSGCLFKSVCCGLGDRGRRVQKKRKKKKEKWMKKTKVCVNTVTFPETTSW